MSVRRAEGRCKLSSNNVDGISRRDRLHDWLCQYVFGGVLPPWLEWLHNLLGLG
jgi:hypothetical protein